MRSDKSLSRGSVRREQPAGSRPRSSTSLHLLVQSCRFLLWRWLTFTAIRQYPHHILLSSSFVLAKLPGHVVRFQRAEIMRARGPCRRAEPEGPKSMTLMFAEALCLLIKPTEGSFLVFFSLVCNYLCWLTPLQRAHFPSTPSVVTFLLSLDSLKPCSLRPDTRTRHRFDGWQSSVACMF